MTTNPRQGTGQQQALAHRPSGRPGGTRWKGRRRALQTRVAMEIADELWARAEAAGVPLSDFLEGILRQHLRRTG